MLNKIAEYIKQSPQELFFRILTTLLSMFILPHIAIVMFIVYMSQNNFFSYDLFSEGMFGMKLFFSIAAFMLLITGIALTGSLIFLVGKAVKKNDYSLKAALKDWGWILLILNIVVSFIALNSSINWKGLSYIFLLSIAINFHIGILIYSRAKIQFFSFLFVIFTIGYFTIFFFKQEASNLLSIGLETFQIGGKNTLADIITKENMSSGNLILIAPNNVYLRDKNGSINIFPINNIVKISVKNNAQTVPKNN